MNSAIIKVIRRVSALFLTIFLSLCLTACSLNYLPERIAGSIIRQIIARDYDLIYGTEESTETAEETGEKEEEDREEQEEDLSGEAEEDEDSGPDEDSAPEDDGDREEPEEDREEPEDEEEDEDTEEELTEEAAGEDPAVSDTVSADEIADIPEEDEKAYYFSNLSTGDKKLYLEIYNALFSMEDKVTLSSRDQDQVDRIFNIVLMDHPEMFYCDGYSTTVINSGEEIISIAFSGKYNTPKSERKNKEAKIKEAADAILKKVPSDDSDYEKAKYIFEWIINHTEYNINAPDNQNISSVLLNHSSVCQGYSMTTKYLLDKLGIFCIVVYGSASDESHSWNLAKLDGTYCYIDTTWGDSSYRDINDSQANRISYNYFGCNSDILLRTHQISDKGKLPECTSLDEYYYVKESMYFTKVDMGRLKAVFDHEQQKGEHVFTIRASSEEVYNDLFETLFTDKEIFNLVKNADKVTYIEDKKEYTLTFNI